MQLTHAPGSLHSAFSAEAVSSGAAVVARKCVLVPHTRFSADLIRDLDDKKAQAIVVLLPPPGAMLPDQRRAFQDAEAELLTLELNAAVYFVDAATPGHAELQALIDSGVGGSGTLVEAFLRSRVHVEAIVPEPARVPVTAHTIQVPLRARCARLTPFSCCSRVARSLVSRPASCRPLRWSRTTTRLPLPRCAPRAGMPGLNV